MWLKALALIAFGFLGSVSENKVQRHLVFGEGSRFFFSVDLRDNLFDNYKLFAHVLGVKMDWDLPSGSVRNPKMRIKRIHLFEGIENLLYKQNFNGTYCIRKFICEASVILPESNHFLAQLCEVVFSDKNISETNIKYFDKDCNALNLESNNKCPFSLLSLLSGSQTYFNFFL